MPDASAAYNFDGFYLGDTVEFKDAEQATRVGQIVAGDSDSFLVPGDFKDDEQPVTVVCVIYGTIASLDPEFIILTTREITRVKE